MSNEKGSIPNLRFPEFRKSKEWRQVKLNSIGEFSGGGTPDTNVTDYWDGDIQWYTPSEIAGKYLSTSRRKITEEGLRNSSAKLLPQGTILITTRATIGSVAISGGECATNQGFQSLVTNDGESNEFWYYWLLQNKHELVRRSSGSTFPEIGKTEIAEIIAYRPEFNEQQKIADCLSSLDELLAAEADRLEALRAHKKGLMQVLFSNAKRKKWRKTTFGEIAQFINGRAYKQDELLESGKYPVLRVGNFFTNKEWYYSDLELEPDKYCDKGDLLYAWSASFGPRIWHGEKVIYHYHIWKVVPDASVDKGFLFNLLEYETENMKSESANGIAMLHITKGTIEGWSCLVPEDKNEQQKIAACLSSVDELIAEQEARLEGLRAHKRGLMQGLFA